MQVHVIIELVVATNITGAALISSIENRLPEFIIDATYQPVQMEPTDDDRKHVADSERVITVRGIVEQEKINDIEKKPGVLHIWKDAVVEPFSNSSTD